MQLVKRRKSIRRLVAYSLLAALLSSVGSIMPVQAADVVMEKSETADVRQQARQLIDMGKDKEAYDMLKKQYAQHKEDMEFNFLLGRAAYDIDRPEEAIGYFKAVLQKQPNLPRVRLELGRAYVAAGMIAEGRREMEAVRATNPPAAVGENIKRFLSMLDNEKGWQVRLNVGTMYDSNSNLGPSTDLNSLPTYNPASTPNLYNTKSKADFASVAQLSVDNIQRIDRQHSWQSDFTMRHIGYYSNTAATSDQLFLSSGPVYNEKQYVLSLPITASYTAIDSATYNHSYGFAPQIQYNLAKNRSLIISSSLEKRNYVDAYNYRNGNVWSNSISHRWQLNNSDFWQVNYRYTKENAVQADSSNNSSLLSAGYYKMLSNGWSYYVEPGYAWTKYSGVDSTTQVLTNNTISQVRSDRQFLINCNLAKIVGNWQYVLAGTYTSNHSNLDLYGYNRSQILLQANRGW